MNVQVIQLAPIRVLMLRHRGSYEGVAQVFDKLWEWTQKHKVPTKRTIGIYYDNPDFVPTSKLRSAACFEVAPAFQIADPDGTPVEIGEIAGGEYATTRFTGPYENLEPVWTRFTQYVEGTLQRTISKKPAFELYINDAGDTPPDQLITELYMPLE